MKTPSQFRTNLSARGIGTAVTLFVIVIGMAAWWNLTQQAARDRSGEVETVPGRAGEVASISSAAPSVASPYPAASLPSGVVPTRAEADIREIATSDLNRMAESAQKMGLEQAPDGLKIQSVSATRWIDVVTQESRAGAPEIGSADALRIVWVVRGEGSFLVMRTPPGGEPFVGKSGYLLIDDETGTILGMGTP